jgi:flagellar biosynthesis/type III secretory pathway M-ring protein FliF/YscJ
VSNQGLTDSERELLQRFAEDNLSRAEYEFVIRKLETEAEWKRELALIRQNFPLEEEASQQENISEKRKEKTPGKSMAPPRWMLIVMIIGWVVLFVIVFSMMMDVDQRLLEIEEQEKIKLKKEQPAGK